MGNLEPLLGSGAALSDLMGWVARNFDASVTWKDVEWVRSQWHGPLVIKGILDPDDAHAAVANGVDGIVVSNHGGRQLDGALSSARALPPIADAVAGRLAILADGGVCLYEPRAVVDHHHRADWRSLRTQMRAYMRGHVAALLIQHARFGHRGNLRRALWQLPRYFLDTALDLPFQRTRRPRGVVLWEQLRGWASGLACALRPGGRRARSY